MIFWIFVILTVVGIAVIVATRALSDKYSYSNENNKKMVGFAYHNDKTIYWISGVIAVIRGIVVATML